MTQLTEALAPAKGEKLVYTAKTHTTGGRGSGTSHSSDGRLDIKLSIPGAPGAGTNPSSCSPRGGRPASKVRWRLWLAKGKSDSPLTRPSMLRWT